MKVVFRAEGNASIGSGHIVRCASLAEMISSYYDCILLCFCSDENLLQSVQYCFGEIVRIPERPESEQKELSYLKDKFLDAGDIIILDGYSFGESYQYYLKKQGFNILSIDDLCKDYFFADAVLNHSGGISPKQYCSAEYTQFFLGPKYALLRKEFRQPAIHLKPPGYKKNIFVCLGGSDPENKTEKVLKLALTKYRHLQYHVVVGHSYVYLESLLRLTSFNTSIKIYTGLSASKLHSVMRSCAFGVTSPSTIAYEYLTTGGNLFLYQTAENQNYLYGYLISESLAWSYSDLLSAEFSFIPSKERKQIFKGNTASHILKIINFLSLTVRPAVMSDLKLYYTWANEKTVRQQSYNQELISPHEHKAWFQEKISSNSSLLLVLCHEELPIGQVRFELEENLATINYSLDKEMRGKGFGEAVLRKGIIEFYTRIKSSITLVGYVKEENIPSIHIFESLGFKKDNKNKYNKSIKFVNRERNLSRQ